MLEDVDPSHRASRSARRSAAILVPMKLGDIGEEMVATAVALAKDEPAHASRRSPSSRCRASGRSTTRFPPTSPSGREASVEEARALGEENGVDVVAEAVRARSIGHAIVDEAARRGVRPDRARLVAALAAAVPILLADGRPRAQARALRGARRRVPRRRLRARARRVSPGNLNVRDEGRDRGMWADGIGCGKQLAGGGLGRHVRRRGRDGARAARRLARRLRRRARDGPRGARARRDRRAPTQRSSSTDGDNSNVVIGQVVQRRYQTRLRRRPGARSAPRGVLRGARACGRCVRRRRRSRRSPRSSAPACADRASGAPADVRDRRRRRQGRGERHPLARSTWATR